MEKNPVKPIQCVVCNSNSYKPLFIIPPRRIVECSNCGYEYVNPIPPFESLPEIKMENEEESIQSQIDITYLNRVFEKYKVIKGKLLDVGSGNGRIERKLIESGWSEEDIYLLDLSEKNLQSARLRYPSANIVLGNAEENLGFNDQFDCILMIEFLEHAQNPTRVLKNALDALKQRGILVLRGLPNNRSLEAFLGLERWSMRQFPHHYHFFNQATFSSFIGNFPQAKIQEFGTFLQNGYRFYDIVRIARNIGEIKKSEEGRCFSYEGKPLNEEEITTLVLTKLRSTDFEGYKFKDRLPKQIRNLLSREEAEDFFNRIALDPVLSPDFTVVIRKEHE